MTHKENQVKLAKEQVRHAEKNMQTQKELKNEYGVATYKVRIAALKLFIKINSKQHGEDVRPAPGKHYKAGNRAPKY